MRANEIRRAVVQLPASAHQWDTLFLLVSCRETEVVVNRPEARWRLFDDICKAAALCEGSDLVVNNKAIKPEQYIRLWREELSAAITLEQAAEQGIIFSAELVVDPAEFAEGDASYYLEKLAELRKQKTPMEQGSTLIFHFDMNNVEDIKLLYSHRHLHTGRSKIPISAVWHKQAAKSMGLAFGDLFGEVPA